MKYSCNNMKKTSIKNKVKQRFIRIKRKITGFVIKVDKITKK